MSGIEKSFCMALCVFASNVFTQPSTNSSMMVICVGAVFIAYTNLVICPSSSTYNVFIVYSCIVTQVR